MQKCSTATSAESIHGDRDSDMPELVNMRSGLRAYIPSLTRPMPYPHRSAEEYAHRAAWARRHIESHTEYSAGLVYNTIDHHYYRQIIYGGNAVPVSDYRPQQELLQAVLYDAACRIHNNEFPGTFLVASLLPDAPARFSVSHLQIPVCCKSMKSIMT